MAEAILEKLEHEISEAFKSGDASKLAEYYTEDCKLMLPGQATLNGREGIKESAEKDFFGRGVTNLDWERIELIDAGDYIIHVANFTAQDKEGAMLFDGKYVGVFKQEDGKWKCHIDISNDNPKK